MAEQRVMIIGGGLAGLGAAMKLAELDIPVDIISLTPVKRSHSVCAQGGINSCNDQTRQLGDSEWKHFDDTVYGGDFLQHQPPVKEMAYWAPKVIDLMDRLGVTFNRTTEGFLDRRRFGGTLYRRTAFAGATTGQQLLYALDEQVGVGSQKEKFANSNTGIFSVPSSILGSLPRMCRTRFGHHGNSIISCKRSCDCLGWLWIGLWPFHDVDGMYRKCCKSLLSSRSQVCQWRIHSSPSNGDSRCRQIAINERICARRRWPCLGTSNTP